MFICLNSILGLCFSKRNSRNSRKSWKLKRLTCVYITQMVLNIGFNLRTVLAFLNFLINWTSGLADILNVLVNNRISDIYILLDTVDLIFSCLNNFCWLFQISWQGWQFLNFRSNTKLINVAGKGSLWLEISKKPRYSTKGINHHLLGKAVQVLTYMWHNQVYT